MHLPKAALRSCSFTGFRSNFGIGMEIDKRKMPVDYPKIVSEHLLKLLDGRKCLGATGTLNVPIVNEGDRCICRTLDMIVNVEAQF